MSSENINLDSTSKEQRSKGARRKEEETPKHLWKRFYQPGQDNRRTRRKKGNNNTSIAVYKDENELHPYSAVCTHMRCTVTWNPMEKSFDCPCHGSRFSWHRTSG